MGNISSKPDEGATLYLKDQARFTISHLTINNSSQNVAINITPNAFPASRFTAKRDLGDDTPVEYVQDSDTTVPFFMLRLNSDDDLTFRFTFSLRQNSPAVSGSPPSDAGRTANANTSITGLTFAHASTARDLDNLVTREFRADPNLHKNSNVQLVGDFSTDGRPVTQFEWSWKWRPPKPSEDKGGGWRNSCSFLEYDQRAHRLNTLATFTFWVQNVQKPVQQTPLPSPRLELPVPPKLRIASSQSYQSKSSDPDQILSHQDPPSPLDAPAEANANEPFPMPKNTQLVDVSCPRPSEDMSAVDDGPLFRATIKSLEQRTGSMRTRMKKVLKKAEAAQQARVECNQAMKAFLAALQEASGSNTNALKPALDHYFNRIAQQILDYETQNSVQLQRLIIEPLSKLYNLDIKQVEFKKKDFDEESRDYYAYVGRYLGQRQDSLKDKKRAESDNKYQTKRRNFELKRFDYTSFMQDLHGGRKEQELLSHLTRYARGQATSFLDTARKIEDLSPQLDALVREVADADREFSFQRTEREEKRRTLEKSTASYNEPASSVNAGNEPGATSQNGYNYNSDSDLGRADSTSSQLAHSTSVKSNSTLSPRNSTLGPPSGSVLSTSPGGTFISPAQNRFKGIRDLEERENNSTVSDKGGGGPFRKEGLLWALSRPGSHIDPKGINKQAWHKFWIVLDQGRLSEYSNWKQRLDLHMEPIDLRMASVRTARDADRRFCFEVITPQFKRIYQATSEEDMGSWIGAINNALQSAVEGQGVPSTPRASQRDSSGRDIGSALTGKSSSYSGQHGSYVRDPSSVNRSVTLGSRPSYVRTDSNSFDENPSKLLQLVRDADQGNQWCADCSSNSKVEWVSINLGIILCIECGGIHRSLGTHISKVRSLTLDTLSFTNDLVELLIRIGNRVSNMTWEGNLDRGSKPSPNCSREQRLKFITAKYVERAYVTPMSNSQSRFGTPEETLLASIKKGDIQGVLYGIALKANVNACDRSRNTHAVFLALAAADPAAPASASSSPAASPNSKPTVGGGRPRAFPVAELLMQNGAEVPLQKPAIPLSAAAQLYLEQRTNKMTGAPPVGSGDTLTVTPLTIAARSPTPTGTAERDNPKLPKRGYGGSRFAEKVASLGDR